MSAPDSAPVSVPESAPESAPVSGRALSLSKVQTRSEAEGFESLGSKDLEVASQDQKPDQDQRHSGSLRSAPRPSASSDQNIQINGPAKPQPKIHFVGNAGLIGFGDLDGEDGDEAS